MREIEASLVTDAIREMCIEANLELSNDMKDKLKDAMQKETSELGKQILTQLDKNMQIAKENLIPICQDTGMTTVFVQMGQDVHVTGNMTDAINEGIREGYEQGIWFREYESCLHAKASRWSPGSDGCSN